MVTGPAIEMTKPLLGQTAPAIHRCLLTPADLPAVSALNAAVFGPGRFARTAYRVREGSPPVSPFCRGAFSGNTLIASLRMTPIAIGASKTHLLLGPLAVAAPFAGQGHGKALVSDAIAHAQAAGIASIVLIGDMPYYERFGFTPIRPGKLAFPGPVNPARVLGLALKSGRLDDAHGLVAAVTSQEN
jgi:predicted N-acetyltransferase YhbS